MEGSNSAIPEEVVAESNRLTLPPGRKDGTATRTAALLITLALILLFADVIDRRNDIIIGNPEELILQIRSLCV